MATLESLAGIIAGKSAEVSKLLAAKGKPSPSFGESSYADFANEEQELRVARNALVTAAQDILRLARGPEDNILNLIWSTADTANIGTIIRFEIAQNVPLNGTISVAELSKKVKLPEDLLTRTMRFAIGNGVFTEPAAGVYAHSANSAILAHSEHLRNIGLASTHEMSYMMTKIPEALYQQKEKGSKGPQAAFNVEWPEYPSIFEFMVKNTELAENYHKYMSGRTATSRWATTHLKNAWDWSSIGSKTIVDVGGSSGHTCQALAPICKEAKFIVQDVDPVALEQGRKRLASSGADFLNRLEFVTYNFFEPQPVSAEFYILRHILHDWPDEDCVKIIKNQVPALKTGARILISEGIVREPPAVRANTLDEKQILLEDTFMLAAHGAKERTSSEFAKIFKEADSRFEYIGTTGGNNGAFQSIVEFEFKA